MKIKLLLLTIGLFCFTFLQAQDNDTATQNNEDEVFRVVEDMPRFPGGEDRMFEYIDENIDYPETARKEGVRGIVYVGIIVEPDGTLSNVEVKRGIGAGCDEAAVEVVSEMPEWIPGKQRGKPVRVQYVLGVDVSP